MAIDKHILKGRLLVLYSNWHAHPDGAYLAGTITRTNRSGYRVHYRTFNGEHVNDRSTGRILGVCDTEAEANELLAVSRHFTKRHAKVDMGYAALLKRRFGL